MRPERWQQIDSLLDAALPLKPAQRAAFLDEACAGDEELRREVDALLAREDLTRSFLETGPAAAAAELLADSPPTLKAGQRLGHYGVVGLLGRGGMGEVYVAQDARLGRKVALKVLGGEVTGDLIRVRRFEQEARAASALSHPNILTVYEIGEADGIHYIATELVEGQTLRQLLGKRQIRLKEALDLAIQVSSALSAAHRAGIVHRDLKPENLMLREDGYVKVLDFGLAKLTELPRPNTASEPPDLAPIKTDTGVVMGTAHYMSPEQARGQPVDARTDLFSLGVVLYQMLTGHVPFQGETPSHAIVSILEKEPPPLSCYLSAVPAALQQLVDKTLRKDREQRYQSAQQLAADLKSLKHRLELAGELERPMQRSSSRQQAISEALDAPEAQAGRGSSRPISSPERGARGIRRRTLAWAALITVGTAGLGSWFIWQRLTAGSPPEIRSLAVLPFKSEVREATEDYLGLGIANEIITKVSQTGLLTVRPTSAVRKYASQEIDALQAARELNVDAVLDSTFLHLGDRLRVSVNLLRVEDGASLWAERFDERFTDIFAIQDKVSQQVAQRLRLRLSPAEQARLAKRSTSNPEAYEYYAKALYHFGNITPELSTRSESDLAVDLFKKAIELDPNYALAHAQLGYAYTKIAVFQEDDPALIELAKLELRIAEGLDPQLADVHLARYFIEFSHYEGWQVATAIRELRLAQRLDPNIGHSELGDLYHHIGLEDQAVEEFEIALKADPNSGMIKHAILNQFFTTARPDEGLVASQRLFRSGPDLWYYLEKRMVEKAEPLVEQELQDDPRSPWLFVMRILLLALEGKHEEAEAAVPSILARERRYRGYHHDTYNIARIYALGGKSEEALKWLRVTVAEGFPCYPLFERDSFLDPIRKDPAFLEFLAEMKARWEGYQRQFG